MRRQELSGSVHCSDRFVKHLGIGLEDVGHPRSDVERDLDIGDGGLSRETNGVVEENLVTSGLDAQSSSGVALRRKTASQAHGYGLPGPRRYKRPQTGPARPRLIDQGGEFLGVHSSSGS
jgi:hypothetical protein